MQMKIFKIPLVATAAVVVSLGALAADTKTPTWTILYYGHGDHNLSPSLADDLLKIEKVGSSDTFRIVGQLDFDASRAEDNQAYGLPAELNRGVTRVLFQKSDDDEHFTSKPLERLPELNMDEPHVLQEFLEWGFRKYPADRYAVILSDHGGQWEGFGGDSQDGTLNDSRGITTVEIAAATRTAMKECGIGELAFFGFDACLMGAIEVLDCFHGICGNFIACPEIDFGDGWGYTAALGWLKEHPDAAGNDFGKVEVAAWRDLHMQDQKDSDLTLAAHACYDMTKYPAVRDAFAKFAGRLANEVSPSNLLIYRERRFATEYSIPSGDGLCLPAEIIDLGAFAHAFAKAEKASPALRQAAARLEEAIAALVVEKAIGVDKLGAMGLSVWYPLLPVFDEEETTVGGEEATAGGEEEESWEEEAGGEEGEDEGEEESTSVVNVEEMKEDFHNRFREYRKMPLFICSPWPSYLEKVMRASEKLPDDALDIKAAFRKRRLKSGETLHLPVTIQDSPGSFLLHGTLYARRGKTDTYISYGEVVTLPLSGVARTAVDWKAGLIHLVGGGKSTPLAFYPVDIAGEYQTAWAKLYPPGKGGKAIDMRFIVRVKDNRARLVQVVQDEDELSPVPVRLEKGMRIRPVYWTELRKGPDSDKWQEGTMAGRTAIPVTGDGAVAFEFRPIAKGGYTLELSAEDVAARYGETCPIYLKID